MNDSPRKPRSYQYPFWSLPPRELTPDEIAALRKWSQETMAFREKRKEDIAERRLVP